MASVPRVPGLNRTQLVSVGIFGEAFLDSDQVTLSCVVLSCWIHPFLPPPQKPACTVEAVVGNKKQAIWGSYPSLPPRAPMDGIKGEEGVGARECSAESVL